MSDDSKKKPLQASASALGVRLRGCDVRTAGGGTLVTRLRSADEMTLEEQVEELKALTAAVRERTASVQREIAARSEPLTRPEALRVVARETDLALERGEKLHDALAKLRADRPDLAEAFKN